MAAHPLTGLAAFFLLGALRAVFGPVGFWDVPATAQDALFSFPAVEQGGAQAFVGGSVGKQTIKYNPRDMSTIYLQNSAGEHLPVGFKDLTRPPITKHELDIARDALLERGRDSVNEDRLFELVSLRRDHIGECVAKTKKARRQATRIAQALAEGKSVAEKALAPKKRVLTQRSSPPNDGQPTGSEEILPLEVEFDE